MSLMDLSVLMEGEVARRAARERLETSAFFVRYVIDQKEEGSVPRFFAIVICGVGGEN